MKIFKLAVLAILILSASCKERNVVIATASKPTDTTYTADVEKPQAKMVLLEEFTGVRCSPCVVGHQIIYGTSGILSQHPGQVAVIAYHIINHPQTEPISGHSKLNFRSQDATDVGNIIFGTVGDLPNAGFDRVSKNNSYLFDKAFWADQATQALGIDPAANVYITSSYDAATHNTTVKVKVAYTQKVSKKQSITLAVIENGLVDAQEEFVQGSTIYADDYVHHAVLRHIITQPYGDPIMDDIQVKEPGRVYERSFSFNLNPAWNADNCQLVAFVHDNEGTDKTVLQAAQINLK